MLSLMGIPSLESALWDSMLPSFKCFCFSFLVTVNALLQFLSCFCKLCFCKCVSSPFFLFLVNVIFISAIICKNSYNDCFLCNVTVIYFVDSSLFGFISCPSLWSFVSLCYWFHIREVKNISRSDLTGALICSC